MNKPNWERSLTVGMTKDRGEPSQFDPNLTDAQLEAIHLACVNAANLIRDVCHKRTYGMDTGQEIGASDGRKTQFIFVEYVNSGLVHGYPVTRQQLARKRTVQ